MHVQTFFLRNKIAPARCTVFKQQVGSLGVSGWGEWSVSQYLPLSVTQGSTGRGRHTVSFKRKRRDIKQYGISVTGVFIGILGKMQMKAVNRTCSLWSG